MTVSNTRLLAELLRVATREERRSVYGDNMDFDALDGLVAMSPPLVTPTVPRRVTAEGARVVSELLAVFEEQT